MTDLSGQYFGRYYLTERLGEGGMAMVYKAYDTRLERDVAVKVIRAGAFRSEEMDQVLKRFEREAKALARLSHPNIVKVHDYGEHEGSPYLVMEYLPGGTLKKLLGQPVQWQTALRLLLPIARGVAYAHEQGILHRDIKPANILVTGSGEPMLSDFGIAKLFESEQSLALTSSGMAVGTPEYMAPEQWNGVATPQSDLYSLGIVLYEMVAGRKPYVADTLAAILIKQATEALPRPRQFVPNLPGALENLLVKALAREPGDRYPDVNALAQAMEQLLTSAPTVPLPMDVTFRPDEVPAPPPPKTGTTASVSQTGSSTGSHPGTGSRQRVAPRGRSPLGWLALFGGVGFFAFLGVVVIGLLLLPNLWSRPVAPEPTLTVTFSPVPPTLAASVTPPPPTPTLAVFSELQGFVLVEPHQVQKAIQDASSFTQLATERYTRAEEIRMDVPLTYTVYAQPGVSIYWGWDWCAVDRKVLDDNLTHITISFEAEGAVIPLNRLDKVLFETDALNYKGWDCVEYRTVLQDWKPGTYHLRQVAVFRSDVNDGRDIFRAGQMLRDYTVTISK